MPSWEELVEAEKESSSSRSVPLAPRDTLGLWPRPARPARSAPGTVLPSLHPFTPLDPKKAKAPAAPRAMRLVCPTDQPVSGQPASGEAFSPRWALARSLGQPAPASSTLTSTIDSYQRLVPATATAPTTAAVTQGRRTAHPPTTSFVKSRAVGLGHGDRAILSSPGK